MATSQGGVLTATGTLHHHTDDATQHGQTTAVAGPPAS